MQICVTFAGSDFFCNFSWLSSTWTTNASEIESAKELLEHVEVEPGHVWELYVQAFLFGLHLEHVYVLRYIRMLVSFFWKSGKQRP